MRSLLTGQFRAKKDVTDLTTINRLLALGRMELEEVLQMWKGDSHMNNMFEHLEEQERLQTVDKPTFLDSFFSGKP